MIKPLDVDMKTVRINRTLHGRSAYRVQNVDGHNVVRYYNQPGHGDGIDLFAAAGTEVRACHDGVVSRVFDRSGKLSGCYVAGAEGISVYAHLHLKNDIRMYKKVEEGEVIGYIGRLLADPHLHFELELAGNKIITGFTPERFRANLFELFS